MLQRKSIGLPSILQHRDEMPQLFIDLRRCGNSVRNLGAQELAVGGAQTMQFHANYVSASALGDYSEATFAEEHTEDTNRLTSSSNDNSLLR